MLTKLDVQEHIVNFNSCISCGLCEIVCPEECITMVQDKFLSFKPQVDYAKCTPCLDCVRVCPDSFHLINKIEKNSTTHPKDDKYIGNYINSYYGYVSETSSRIKSTSGGILTKLFQSLHLKNGVDAVIVVRSDELNQVQDEMFAYSSVEQDIDGINKGRGSKYISIDYHEALKQIKSENLRVAIVATPCVCTGLRKLQEMDEFYKEHIKYLFSFTCGHTCKPIFAQKLSTYKTQKEFDEIRFRSKTDAKSAEDYKFETLHNGQIQTSTAFQNDVYGQLWSSAAFMEDKCLKCDDVFARHADITVMDSWGYSHDKKGQSFIITRNKELDTLLDELKKKEEIYCEEIDKTHIINSQPLPILEKIDAIKNKTLLLNKLGEIGKYSYLGKKYKKERFSLHYLYHNISVYLRVKLSGPYLKKGISYKKLVIFRIIFEPLLFIKKIYSKILGK